MGAERTSRERRLRNGRIARRTRRGRRRRNDARGISARAPLSALDAARGWLVVCQQPLTKIPTVLRWRVPIRARPVDLVHGHWLGDGSVDAGAAVVDSRWSTVASLKSMKLAPTSVLAFALMQQVQPTPPALLVQALQRSRQAARHRLQWYVFSVRLRVSASPC